MPSWIIIAGVALLPLGSPAIAHADTIPASFPVSGYATTTEALIARYSAEFGASGDQMARTIQCESDGNAAAVGDHGHSFGIVQIYLPAHPDISKKQALDKEWSIKWMAQQFAAGRESMWTCWRQLRGS